jgi:hypothetical protein
MEAALSVDDHAAFKRGIAGLRQFKASVPHFIAPNFAVEIAVLLHRVRPGLDDPSGPASLVASPGSGPPISTGDLQHLVCDETYAKREDFLPKGAEGPIYKPFTGSFKSRKANNWRNSLDVQRGLGCDAPFSANFLQSDRYLEEPRFDCQFRDPDDGGCESPSGITGEPRTCFNPAKRPGRAAGPDSRAGPAPKLLTRTETPSVGYWYVEPTLGALEGLLGPDGRRVPLYPFLVVLYGGSPYFGPWGGEVSRDRFEADVRLSKQHLAAIFDPDPDSPLNAQLLRGDGRRAPRRSSAAAKPAATLPLSAPVPYAKRSQGSLVERAERQADPVKRLRLMERSRRGHQRTLDALAAHLEGLGGFRLEEQLDGFDLLAVSGNEGLLFEVKTWTTVNLSGQVRRGWAQLREYRYRNREILPSTVKLYLVLDREPPEQVWLWTFLLQDCDVVPVWIKRGELATLPRLRRHLPGWSAKT